MHDDTYKLSILIKFSTYDYFCPIKNLKIFGILTTACTTGCRLSRENILLPACITKRIMLILELQALL